MVLALFTLISSLCAFANVDAPIEYVPVETLVPGQMSISYQEVEAKLRKEGRELKFQNGQAWVDEDEVAPVIKLSNGKYLMADKHHHLAASLRAGATLYPIRVVKDLSHLELDEAYIWAKDHGMIYLEPEENLAQLKFMRMILLKDNPWRWMVNQVRVKLKLKREEGQVTSVEVVEVKNAKDPKKVDREKPIWYQTPVWGKIVDEAKDFSELALATLLRLEGIEANADIGSKAVRERIRDIFNQAVQRVSPLIAGITVVTKATPVEEIDWEEAIQTASDCQKLLAP